MSLSQDRESIVSIVRTLLLEGAATKAARSDLISTEGARLWKAQDFLAAKAIEETQDEELERRFSELVPRNAILVDRLNKELTGFSHRFDNTTECSQIHRQRGAWSIDQ